MRAWLRNFQAETGQAATSSRCPWWALAAILLTACSPPQRELQQHEAYVWQRRWTPDVRAALAESAPLLGGWRVLAAEIDREGRLFPVAVDFPTLTDSGQPVFAVIRIEKALDDNNAERIAEQLNTVVESWRHSPVRLAGIEIDHDAPLRALYDYGRFLQGMRRRLEPGLALSITTLPAWLENRQAFQAVLAPVDEAVLQLHALDHPARQLFDPEHAWRWIREFAQNSRKPFRIALPNYGSRVGFDDNGRILTVESEGPALLPKGKGREYHVSPRVIADFLVELAGKAPDQLRGIVWFRLPVSGDRRCWSRSTWHAVLRRQALDSHLSAEVAPADAEGWQSLRLRNDGLIDAEFPTEIHVSTPCQNRNLSYLAEQNEEGTHWLRQEKGLLQAGETLAIGRMRCPKKPGLAQIRR